MVPQIQQARASHRTPKLGMRLAGRSLRFRAEFVVRTLPCEVIAEAARREVATQGCLQQMVIKSEFRIEGRTAIRFYLSPMRSG